jgi:hypothetical protein
MTDFGTVEIVSELWGKRKAVPDVVQHRAILVTDQAVLWVDTDEFRIAEAKEFREARAAARPVPDQETVAWKKLNAAFAMVPQSLAAGKSTLKIEPKYGFNDNFVIELPSQLTIFRPIFSLSYGGHTYKAESNVIDGDRIVLQFAAVDNLDGNTPAPKDAELTIGSVFGDVLLTFSPEGPTTYRFSGAK